MGFLRKIIRKVIIFSQRTLKRKAVIYTFGIFIALVILSQGFISKLRNAEFRSNLLQNYSVITRLLPIYWKIRKLSDITYLPYYFLKEDLPVYELTISRTDQKKMDESLPDAFSGVYYTSKEWVDSTFMFEGKEYKTTVRYRGDNAIHWNAPKKSYLVEFDKDNLFHGGSFQGIRRLSFIIVDDRYFALEEFNNYRADKLGLKRPQSGIGKLTINGEDQGVYFIIENWSREMMSKWEAPDETNFYGDADPTPSRNFYIPEKLQAEYLDRWDVKVSDTRFPYTHYSEIYKLSQLIYQAPDDEFKISVFDFVDKEDFYNWQIHQELINADHEVHANYRVYVNNASGKISFIPWDVESGRVEEDNYDLYSPLGTRIFSNPYFLYEKNKLVYDYVNDEKNLKDDLKVYDMLYDKIKTEVYKDRMKIYTNRFADRVYQVHREKIINTFEKLKNIFEKSFVSVVIHLTGDDQKNFSGQNALGYFDTYVASAAGVFLEDVTAQFSDNSTVTDFSFYYDKNQNDILDGDDPLMKDYRATLLYSDRAPKDESSQFQVALTKHRIFFTSNRIGGKEFSQKLTSMDIDFENAFTGKNIKGDNKEVKIVNDSLIADYELIADVTAFEALKSPFIVDKKNKRIVLPQGAHDISQKYIIPRGFTVVIEPGAVLRFAPAVSIISYSRVLAEGLPEAPIQFLSQGKDPWGVFAVVNATEKSIFRHTRFVNGKDEFANGIYFSGMLSSYYSPSLVEFSEFRKAQADDALNIKGAEGIVKDSVFSENSSDAIDFDFIKRGEISHNTFFSNGNDGIDFSASTLLVKDNYIEGSGDKCISVGEKTIGLVIYNNVLRSCDIGVEIKDLSDVTIVNNVLINNRIGLHAYQKKPVFGGGRAKVYNSIIWDNETDVKTEKGSEIQIFSSNIKGFDSENWNFSKTPPFRNPVGKDFTLSQESGSIEYTTGGSTEILKEILNVNVSNAPVGLHYNVW